MGVHQEEGNHGNQQVANTSELAERGLPCVPAEGQRDEQHVDDDQVDAKRPNEAVLEGANGEEHDENEGDCKEMCHNLFVAALEEEKGNNQPEHAKEAENSAEEFAVVTADGEEEHPKTSEELTEAAKKKCDIAEAAMQFFMIGIFVDANADLLKAETDDSDKQAEYADCLRVDRHNRHGEIAPFVFKIVL